MRSVIGSIICICTFMCVSCNGTIGKEQSKSEQSSTSCKEQVIGKADLAESHKEEAEQMRDGIIEKEKKAKEYASKVDIAQKAVAAQIARLHREDCTMQTVEDVENWWNDYANKDLCGVDLNVHIKVYKTFFTATSIYEMKTLKGFKSRLSEYQYKSIIRGYCKNSESFNILLRKQRTFKAPYEIGIIP